MSGCGRSIQQCWKQTVVKMHCCIITRKRRKIEEKEKGAKITHTVRKITGKFRI
jgi:hypothetical protein